MEALSGIFLQFIPLRLRGKSSKGGLTPLKDSLVVPEDEAEPSLAQKQRAPTPLSETRQTHKPSSADRFTEVKQPKIRSSSFKNSSLPSKHRSSIRQEYGEFYGSGEGPPFGQIRTKSQEERTKHRAREKNGDANFVAPSLEPKPVETMAANYENTKYYPHNFRSMEIHIDTIKSWCFRQLNH